MVDRTSSVDKTHHIVCGTVSSLSPFGVFVPSNPSSVPAQLQQLQTLINSFNLKKPAAKKFTHRLDDARKAFNKIHKNKVKPFQELAEFIRDVRAQTGKSLTAAEAQDLLLLATQIQSEVGC